MRTTLILDAEQVKRAKELTGIEGTSALVRAAIESLIAQAAVRRLIGLRGAFPSARAPSRRRRGRAA
ncbi:MAG: type II toxin-antitoxin system VapB family antitoxin [Phycisphaerae bacterium]|nr:type II toxin-antitoxin system VapB family antitoxin [Phycisphaerae bacterium]